MKIYESRLHLAVTLAVVVLPFIYLLVFSRLANLHAGELGVNVFLSFGRILLAYCIAVVLAWIFAASFYRGKRGAVALPIFDVLQSFPTFAVLPLAVYLFGASNVTVITFLVLTIIWPILFSIVSSLKLIKHDWEEAVEVSGVRGFDYVRLFLIPASVPGIITGSIIGIGEGWEALIATEIIAGIKNGLGSFFQTFSQNAAVTTFGVLGFLVLIFSINKLVWLPLLEWSHRELEE